MSKDPIKRAHQLRQKNQQHYDAHTAEPTTLEDGTVVRSRLEALWIEALADCASFRCIECVQVPLWIQGGFGKFLSNYRPDLKIELTDGSVILVELKPTAELAMSDDRQQRALELNPKMKFLVIGGYPFSKKGVTVRMLTGKKEVVHQHVQVCDVLQLLECPCDG